MSIKAERVKSVRTALTAIFFLQGALGTVMIPRVPELIEQIDVNFTAWGAILGFSGLGALVGLMYANRYIVRFGSRRVLEVTSVASALLLVSLPFWLIPPLFAVLPPLIFGWLDLWQARRSEATAETAPTPRKPRWVGPPLPAGDYAILIGFGRVGSEIAKLLRERGVPLVVIDDDADLVQKARDEGFPAIRGNAANTRVLDEASPQNASLVILAIPQPLEAGEVVARLRATRPDMTILARAHSDGEVRHLLQHGADGAVLAEKELAHSMAEMALSAPPFRKPRSS